MPIRIPFDLLLAQIGYVGACARSPEEAEEAAAHLLKTYIQAQPVEEPNLDELARRDEEFRAAETAQAFGERIPNHEEVPF